MRFERERKKNMKAVSTMIKRSAGRKVKFQLAKPWENRK